MTSTQELIVAECDTIKTMLLDKNKKYGDSAIKPINIFAKGISNEAQIKVRLDDKINRLVQGSADEDEDVEQDLIGYLVLLRVARKVNKSLK
jgi:hypothetical protein